MRLRAVVVAPAVLALALVIVAGCIGPRPRRRPRHVLATPSPTPAAPLATAGAHVGHDAGERRRPAPSLVDVPAAGLRLPVPEGWELADAEALDDPARRADIVARYPGADALLAAAAEMGDRAVPAFAAFDPRLPARTSRWPPTSPCSSPSRRSAGRCWTSSRGSSAAGFKDAFGAEETARERVATPLGEAVRLEYALPPRDGVALTAVEYVIGAPAGTVLVSVLGPADVVASLDPDALRGGDGAAAVAAAHPIRRCRCAEQWTASTPPEETRAHDCPSRRDRRPAHPHRDRRRDPRGANSRSLRRWNRFLVFAHGGQFLLMVLISKTATLFEPVVPTIKPIIRTASSPASSRRRSCCSPSRSPT